MIPDNIDSIAELTHEVNRAYCAALGDHSQAPWAEAPEWQKKSARDGVAFALSNPDGTPEQSHESWLAGKRADGWKYGAVKDAEKKEHPCFVPYAELPEAQRAKDYLFRAAVTCGTRVAYESFIAGEDSMRERAVECVQRAREEGETDHRSMKSWIGGLSSVRA